MASEELAKKIEDIIAQSLGVARDKVTPEATFQGDLEADSLDIIELVLTLEKTYALSFPEEDARKIRTVQDVVDYVAARAAAPPAT